MIEPLHTKKKKKLKNSLNLQNSILAKINNFYIKNFWHKFKRNIFRNPIRNWIVTNSKSKSVNFFTSNWMLKIADSKQK